MLPGLGIGAGPLMIWPPECEATGVEASGGGWFGAHADNTIAAASAGASITRFTLSSVMAARLGRRWKSAQLHSAQ